MGATDRAIPALAPDVDEDAPPGPSAEEKAAAARRRALRRRRAAVKFWISIATACVVLLLAITYLVVPLFSGARRLETPEVILIATIIGFDALLVGNVGRLKISGSGVELQVRKVRRKQREQGNEIETIKWLLSYFASDAEFEHLGRLESGRTAYDYGDPGAPGQDPARAERLKAEFEEFKRELRALRERGLVQMRKGRHVSDMKPRGDMIDYLELTKRGRSYIRARRREEAPPARAP